MVNATQFIKAILVSAASALLIALPVRASERDALSISADIRRLHMPYGTLIDPIFASSDPGSPDHTRVVGYTRAADSAIWTGHYLAAEAVRYQVTRAPEALNNVREALSGITSLLDVTGTDLLARCLVPTDSPYAASITREEAGHGIYTNTLDGQNNYWIGGTTRDQYSGVFFGLAVAYDMVDDENVRSQIEAAVTRMLDFLLRNNWHVVMPTGTISNTFIGRPDQQLSLLQVGRHVNAARYDLIYKIYRLLLAPAVVIPIEYECANDHGSYFKFNLDYINLYNLIRLEDRDSLYRGIYMYAYNRLRDTTERHGNAHFNMVDRALTGAERARDAETGDLLESWLNRTRRDYYVDLRGRYAACGADKACHPTSIEERVRTDFLWQRSPFLLYGGGSGTIESAGIDYILPYWMARYYKVLS